MAKNVIKDVVLKYLESYPKLSKRALAALIHEREQGLFTSPEAARRMVRYYTGASGNRDRPPVKNSPHFNISTITEGLKKAGVVSRNEDIPPVVLQKGKYLILSDIHIPYQIDEVLAVALDYGVQYQPDGIILNGDIMDCYGVSSFTKEIKRTTVQEELDMVNAFLDLLREIFPIQKIWYKFGNHEERMRNYIIKNARDLHDVRDLALEAQLRLKQRGIKLVGREVIKAGKLNIIHGHETGESIMAPVNPARGMFLKAKTSTLAGHNHQVSEHGESNMNEEQIVCYSTGCLCTLKPDYRPMAYMKWAHGFATVEVFERGMFKVRNMKIVKGEVI